jgi:hypothetical protein
MSHWITLSYSTDESRAAKEESNRRAFDTDYPKALSANNLQYRLFNRAERGCREPRQRQRVACRLTVATV